MILPDKNPVQIGQISIIDAKDLEGGNPLYGTRIRFRMALIPEVLKTMPQKSLIEAMIEDSKRFVAEKEPNTLGLTVKRKFTSNRYDLGRGKGTVAAISLSFNGKAVNQPKIVVVDAVARLEWSVSAKLTADDLHALIKLRTFAGTWLSIEDPQLPLPLGANDEADGAVAANA